ncbi:1,2-phenylacetyl-CoA epoxidase subunit PaaE [Sphaerisporangium sp. B11E5]|uniref:1,2-phenylacetyl-CoA epoxidase subunit PaaE n=1 Tax=Sphaerisporangium sp. B11E5 TaxID=3153563 RepID=UPI00325F867C
MTLTGVRAGRGVEFAALTVARVDRLCADAVAITFEVPEELAGRYAFRAGQALTVRAVVEGREERRSYSICSPEGGALRIGVREIPGGVFSTWLVRRVRAGDRVEAAPPAGGFVADLERPAHHVFVAAGSGITPVLSIAATALHCPGSRVTLFYGNRSAATVMFAEELADLKDSAPARVHLVHVFSREARGAELLTGRLDPPRLRALLPALTPVAEVGHWWLCGPYAMVTGARQVLAGLGVPAARIHQELFYVEDPPARAPAGEPRAGASEVTAVLDGRATTVTAGGGVTVLEAVRRVRPEVPFACTGGVCGTCRAKVLEGRAGMRRDYALDPAEIRAGYVLTCQAVPATPRVIVDYDA